MICAWNSRLAAASNAFECLKGKATVLVAMATIGAFLSSAGRLTALVESVAVGDAESIFGGCRTRHHVR